MFFAKFSSASSSTCLENSCKSEAGPVKSDIDRINAEITTLKEAQKGKKDDEISIEEKDAVKQKEAEVETLRKKESEIYARCGAENKLVRQLIDLALLSNNMLKGEALNNFLKRSVELL